MLANQPRWHVTWHRAWHSHKSSSSIRTHIFIVFLVLLVLGIMLLPTFLKRWILHDSRSLGSIGLRDLS